jgi:hypothetical protein
VPWPPARPELCLHTAELALYERMGFRRDPFGLLAPVARATGHRALGPQYLRRQLPVVDLEPLPAEIDAAVSGPAAQPTRSAS